MTALTDPPFTLWFENAANLTGDACDTYRAVFTRDDRSLRLIGPIAASRRGCIGSPAATRQSTEYMAALSKVDSYRVDAKALLLRDKDGRMLASFTAIDDISQGRDQIGNGARDQGKTDEGPQLLPRPPLR